MADITSFPNGISSEGFRFRAGTLITVAPFSVGTVSTGLDTVTFAVGNLGGAGTGASHCSAGTATSTAGQVIFNVFGTAAAAATTVGTIHWIAVGT